MRIVSWVTPSFGEIDIEECHSHAENANRAGRLTALIDVKYGEETMNVSLVYEGPEATTEQLQEEFLREWTGEGR